MTETGAVLFAPARPLEDWCDQRELEARLEPGNGSAQGVLHLSEMCFILAKPSSMARSSS
jgi:hypothetical protein